MPGIAKYTQEHGKEFLKLARKSIETKFTGEKLEIPNTIEFKQARGVFVTLTKYGDLRGCIGFSEPVYPLGEALVKASMSAAFNDTRFSPLKEKELGEIEIEVSILTQPVLIKGAVETNFEAEKDGLICEFLTYGALLLPQVAVEYGMDKIQFLECLCQKAGMSPDSWQNRKISFYKFQVQSFKEE